MMGIVHPSSFAIDTVILDAPRALLMTKSFALRIAAMNAMYKLPAHERPSLPADVVDRLIHGQQRKQARRRRKTDLLREWKVSQGAELLEA